MEINTVIRANITPIIKKTNRTVNKPKIYQDCLLYLFDQNFAQINIIYNHNYYSIKVHID